MPNSESLIIGSSIDTPRLLYSLSVPHVGRILHVLREKSNQQVTTLGLVKISPRIEEAVFTLSGGDKVILTVRANVKRPAGVDGVLMQNVDGNLEWQSHHLLEEFEERIRTGGLSKIRDEAADSWKDQFNFRAEIRDEMGEVVSKGLRPPQIGGLYAIGAHWSLYQNPATVVMPTGTGKTETMLAALAAYRPGVTLVAVPSKILRDQTAAKFLNFGLLRSLGNLTDAAKNPIVGVFTSIPKSVSDLSIFDNCNVIVSTMTALSSSAAVPLGDEIARRVGTLIVDEAHHIGAPGWMKFREHFTDTSRILQFTATPYRRDGRLVDGRVIYDYPLHRAQQDGYFKKISFEPVYEIDREEADLAIAQAAIARLKRDISEGKDHSVMARCDNIDRADSLLPIYKKLAPEFDPVIIHSEAKDRDILIEKIKTRTNRIAICVNMLGEGFDLPQLKIAAVHDTHKSLAVLLQFTGRFTRSAGENLGDATVIANIADQEISSALERLYSEDADWNKLLSELSSEASKTHAALVEFFNTSVRLNESENEDAVEISHHLLRPALSTAIYNTPSFRPKSFIDAIPNNLGVYKVWLHEETNTLYFVTRTEQPVKWTRSREIRDRQWSLFVLHYDKARHLLFLSSSDKSSLHDKLAKAVGATSLISGDTIFKSLGHINRLMFQNVGVKKHGRRNLSYAMYTGSDVAEALSISERAGSVKSNLSGTGWEDGTLVTIGCSYKGRIWSRDKGTILEFIKWSEKVGAKLQDASIDTSQIIANVLIPEEVEALPDMKIIGIDWPFEILKQAEERVVMRRGEEERPISMFDMRFTSVDLATNSLEFQICSLEDSDDWGSFKLTVGGTEGFSITRLSGVEIEITIGSITNTVEQFFSYYPPLVRFVDLSELDGNLLIKPQSVHDLIFPEECLESWDWDGVDITKESIWKKGVQREDSIQWKVAQHFIEGGFDVVFDDDSAGEAADLVCLKEEEDHIRLILIHCKFTHDIVGQRVNDVVEVSSQAIRSAKWKWKFKDLCHHVQDREKRLAASQSGRTTRFLKGETKDLSQFVKASRLKEIRPEIIIVQPGVTKGGYTNEQKTIFAAAHSYLKETIGVDLAIICSP